MTILLRTLTHKSVMPKGSKHEDLTVGDLLTTKKVYLIYSYFHYDRITFTDEVLDVLGIKEEDRIEKPGKCPEKFDYYNRRNNTVAAIKKAELHGVETNRGWAIKKKIKKKEQKENRMLYEKADAARFSKAAMQRKNHGK